MSCRFEDQGTAPLSVRDACRNMARRYVAMLPSGFAFAWPSGGLLASMCVGGGSGAPERWWRVRSTADGLPMSVPEVGCNTGPLRVGVDTAHLAESLRDWVRLVCVRLLLDGLLPGRPVGAARCLRRRVRVGRTCIRVCYLRCESRLCAGAPPSSVVAPPASSGSSAKAPGA